MKVLRNYLALAQVDLEKNYKLASPVDNWILYGIVPYLELMCVCRSKNNWIPLDWA
jgi:hypothetical protein